MKNLKLSILTAATVAFFSCNSQSSKETTLQATDICNYETDTTIIASEKDSAVFHLKIKAQIPEIKENRDIACKIQKDILKALTGDTNTVLKENMESYVEKNATEYKEEYKKYREKRKDSTETELPKLFKRGYNCHGGTVYENTDILCYKIDTYSNKAEERSFSGVYFINFDKRNGEQIEMETLFKEEEIDLLSGIIVETIKKDRATNELEEIGFYGTDEIKPTNNFMIDKSGLTFCYNPNEIATHAVGIIYTFVPYDKLLFALKENTPVNNLIK